METKMISFFEEQLQNHVYIRSRSLAMDYMTKVLNMECDCRKNNSEDIRELRHSIIIKFTKLMKQAIIDKKIKKHNSHIYRVI